LKKEILNDEKDLEDKNKFHAKFNDYFENSMNYSYD